MDNYTLNYGKIIMKARVDHKLTQSDLGKLIGIGKTMISNYETNYTEPPVSVLEKIANVMNLSLFELLSYANESNGELELPRAVQPTNDKYIRFFLYENINRETLNSEFYMDYYITLPGFMLNSDGDYICFKIPDDSLTNANIYKNDTIIVKLDSNCPEHSLVLCLHKDCDTPVIRRYSRDGHCISLISESGTGSNVPIQYDSRDENYEIVGYVEKILTTPKQL